MKNVRKRSRDASPDSRHLRGEVPSVTGDSGISALEPPSQSTSIPRIFRLSRPCRCAVAVCERRYDQFGEILGYQPCGNVRYGLSRKDEIPLCPWERAAASFEGFSFLNAAELSRARTARHKCHTHRARKSSEAVQGGSSKRP